MYCVFRIFGRFFFFFCFKPMSSFVNIYNFSIERTNITSHSSIFSSSQFCCSEMFDFFTFVFFYVIRRVTFLNRHSFCFSPPTLLCQQHPKLQLEQHRLELFDNKKKKKLNFVKTINQTNLCNPNLNEQQKFVLSGHIYENGNELKFSVCFC